MKEERPKYEGGIPLDINDPDEPGLECQGCGCRHFNVLHTRRRPNGVILRRRECRHCGRRITTVEKVRDDDPKTGNADENAE